MLDFLKKILLTSGDELQEEEELKEQPVVKHPVATQLSDSLETNSNLRKAMQLEASKDYSPILEKTRNNPLSPSSRSFTRIDVDVVEEKKEEAKPKVEPEVRPFVVKDKTAEIKREPVKRTVSHVNPAYYRPKPVISPMFGISSKEEEIKAQKKNLMKPVESTSDKTIISPMYGQVTSENEKMTRTAAVKKVARKRSKNVNLSLEEMLNVGQKDELEFTLFDMKVDKNEFQSREMKTFNYKDLEK